MYKSPHTLWSLESTLEVWKPYESTHNIKEMRSIDAQKTQAVSPVGSCVSNCGHVQLFLIMNAAQTGTAIIRQNWKFGEIPIYRCWHELTLFGRSHSNCTV